MGADFLIRVLGPVDVVVESEERVVGGHHARKLLAALTISLNHAVPLDQLIEVLWGSEGPSTATSTVQSLVSRLRSLLGPAAIVRADHSYLLRAPPECVDAVRFERLVDAADAARHDPPRCRDLSAEALGLWRGVPFGDFAEEDPFRLDALRLDELRLVATELRLEADIGLGHGDLVVGELQSAVQEHPYRERLRHLLAAALAADGRRVEALRACDEFRQLLGTLGLEPGEELRSLEERIAAGSCVVLRERGGFRR